MRWSDSARRRCADPGRTVIIGDVIVEHQVSINDEVQIAAQEGEAIHLRGPKTLDGQQHITRTPLLGAL